MKYLIVEDDPVQQTLINQYAEETPGLTKVGVCSSAKEATRHITNETVDLVFLDVEMPVMSGVEWVQTLTRKPEVIFITAKPDYAITAFEQNAVDYLVKPIDYIRFQQAVNRARERFQKNAQATFTNVTKEEIFIKEGIDLFRVNTRDIQFVKAEGDYVCLHTDSKKYMILMSMKKLEGRLPEADFTRVHRSFIVRNSKIDSISDYVLTVDEHIIPISKSYKQNLLKRLNLL